MVSCVNDRIIASYQNHSQGHILSNIQCKRHTLCTLPSVELHCIDTKNQALKLEQNSIIPSYHNHSQGDILSNIQCKRHTLCTLPSVELHCIDTKNQALKLE